MGLPAGLDAPEERTISSNPNSGRAKCSEYLRCQSTFYESGEMLISFRVTVAHEAELSEYSETAVIL